MHIIPSTFDDLPNIESLFHLAIQYQRERSSNSWQGMNRILIEQEIRDRLHWKITEAGTIACFFSIAFTDRLVWGDRDAEPSIYLHRIVTNPAYRGRRYVPQILAWAEALGSAKGLQFVRLDTHRDNPRLNAYYRECGFEYCGYRIFSEADGPAVPPHYFGSGLSLYERRIPSL